MTTWVKCTTTDGAEAYVNLATITRILEAGPGRTVISFVGDGSLVVKEAPDDIIPRIYR
jgi:hypothetical protein